MWIRGWSVDGFGHLRNATLEGLTEGVNVILGPNESGKTTVVHFLRWVLFGFPDPRTSVVQQYRPPTGTYGGRVTVQHDGASITAQRFQGQEHPELTGADGSLLAGPSWRDVVGTAGRELFETVFAVTTDELQGFDALSTDEIREHIYAAGIVGQGTSARVVLGELEEIRGALLRPRSGRIRELHRELAERHRELQAAVGEAKGIAARRASLLQMHAEVSDRQEALQALDTELSRVDKLIVSWPSWVAAVAARNEICSLPPEVELPPEPSSALDAAVASVETSERVLEQAEETLRSATRSLEEILLDDRLAALAADARRLERLLPVMDQNRERLGALRSDREHLQVLADERLADLGPAWSSDTVMGLDLSMPCIQAARDHGARVAAAESAHERAGREMADAVAAHESTSSELAILEADALAVRSRFPRAIDVPVAHTSALQLQDLIPRLAQAENEAAGYARLQQLLDDRAARSVPTRESRLVVPALVALAVICGIGGAASLATGAAPAGIVLLVVALGLVAVALVARASSTDRAGEPAPVAQEPSPEPRSATEAPGPESVSALLDAVRRHCDAAGLDERPSIEVANARLRDLDRLQMIENDIVRKRSELERLAEDLARTRTRHAQAREARDAAVAQFHTWRCAQGLPDGLRAADAVALLERCRAARESLEELRRNAEQSARLGATLESHAAAVDELLERAGQPPSEHGGSLVELIAAVTTDERRRRERDAIEARIPDLTAALAKTTADRDRARSELDDLLGDVGVSTAEQYRATIRVEAHRREQRERLRDLGLELAARFGDESAVERARCELERGDLAAWEATRRELAAERAAASERYEEAVRADHDARNELEALEHSADVATLTLRVEALRSELRSAMQDWTVATLAQRGIGDTLRRFETERQPEVVRLAGESFERITHGRYRSVIPEDDSVKVLMHTGERLDAARLSRGTTEQLYLAMRFGLARQHSRTTSLPLVLDDVLVNADEDRRHQLAEELHVVGEDLQVLLFTCHRGTADLLAATGPGATVVEIAT